MSAITLTLLLPGKSVPVQSWTFESERSIRVGRAADNDVVLYSAVVSRHHLELRPEGDGWVAVNLGANGTYMEAETVEELVLEDGMVLRLASSGPKIQIRFQSELSTLERELAKQNTSPAGAGQEQKSGPLHPGDSKETVIN
ncbi:FHA domain-containing protein [Synechocystis salina LEGE 06099]|uniref:FHA domain-containing protein n=1 Tax=Synechocystis salina TaxID=945780 RepID=UPI001881D80E|nr:FHA domain-containing protein [Synechocystis salina]MBE9203223.1 FHA domain-containing protein [Synechocystis salina LEGE 06099]